MGHDDGQCGCHPDRSDGIVNEPREGIRDILWSEAEVVVLLSYLALACTERISEHDHVSPDESKMYRSRPICVMTGLTELVHKALHLLSVETRHILDDN